MLAAINGKKIFFKKTYPPTVHKNIPPPAFSTVFYHLFCPSRKSIPRSYAKTCFPFRPLSRKITFSDQRRIMCFFPFELQGRRNGYGYGKVRSMLDIVGLYELSDLSL